MSQPTREAALEIVISCLKEVLEQSGATPPAPLSPDTVIVGKDAVLDSLGVVSLIVEIEQALDAKHDVQVTLANDKAMSAKNSPFRTVGVLVDHVLATVAEGAAS